MLTSEKAGTTSRAEPLTEGAEGTYVASFAPLAAGVYQIMVRYRVTTLVDTAQDQPEQNQKSLWMALAPC